MCHAAFSMQTYGGMPENTLFLRKRQGRILRYQLLEQEARMGGRNWRAECENCGCPSWNDSAETISLQSVPEDLVWRELAESSR